MHRKSALEIRLQATTHQIIVTKPFSPILDRNLDHRESSGTMPAVKAPKEVASDSVTSNAYDLKSQVANGLTMLKAPLPNPSLQVTPDHQLKAVEAPVFAPKAGEVLLHIKATGVCG
jgi:hypothetical protein